MSYLSQVHRNGWGVEAKNPELAFQYAQKSAIQHHPRGYAMLGVCHQEGVGTHKDITKAVRV